MRAPVVALGTFFGTDQPAGMPLFLCSAKQENGEVEDVDDREQEEMLILAHLSAHGHRTPPSASPSYFLPFAFCTLKYNCPNYGPSNLHIHFRSRFNSQVLSTFQTVFHERFETELRRIQDELMLHKKFYK